MKAGEPHYLIKFIDNSTIYLPGWMTDPLVCHNHVVRDEPYCNISALLNVREYLDQF